MIIRFHHDSMKIRQPQVPCHKWHTHENHTSNPVYLQRRCADIFLPNAGELPRLHPWLLQGELCLRAHAHQVFPWRSLRIILWVLSFWHVKVGVLICQGIKWQEGRDSNSQCASARQFWRLRPYQFDDPPMKLIRCCWFEQPHLPLKQIFNSIICWPSSA